MHFTFYKRFLVIGFCLCALVLNSQNDSIRRQREKNRLALQDRFFWGGNVGAWIGNPTFVDVSPLIGYKVTEKFLVGVGGIYNYYSYTYLGYKYSASFYGGRVNARYFIFDNVFVQAGYDRINRDNPFSAKPDARIWIDNILVGGGLMYPVSDNIYCLATGLWNLNDTPLSPYRNPIIQIGFVAGF